MAVTNNGSNSKGKTSSLIDTVTWSHTVPSGTNRLLLVGWLSTSDFDALTVNWGGVTIPMLLNSGATNRHVSICGLLNPTPGTATMTIQLEASPRNIQGFALNYVGVNPNHPYGIPLSASGSSNAPSVTIDGGSEGLIVSFVGQWRTGATEGLTVGAGQTSRGEDVSTDGVVPMHAGASEIVGSAAKAMDWSSDTNDIWIEAGIPLEPATTVRAGTFDPTLVAGVWF